jgi:hypothetical protein
MLCPSHKLQIVWVVIGFAAVLVVHDFARHEDSAQFLFHHVAVLSDPSTVYVNNSIPDAINTAKGTLVFSVVSAASVYNGSARALRAFLGERIAQDHVNKLQCNKFVRQGGRLCQDVL